VTTSTGLVTNTMTASGECSSSCGVSVLAIATLAAARSRRFCPGFCLAPAVTMMTVERAVTAMSSDPEIRQCGTNWLPWLRSRTSARTLPALTS